MRRVFTTLISSLCTLILLIGFSSAAFASPLTFHKLIPNDPGPSGCTTILERDSGYGITNNAQGQQTNLNGVIFQLQNNCGASITNGYWLIESTATCPDGTLQQTVNASGSIPATSSGAIAFLFQGTVINQCIETDNGESFAPPIVTVTFITRANLYGGTSDGESYDR